MFKPAASEKHKIHQVSLVESSEQIRKGKKLPNFKEEVTLPLEGKRNAQVINTSHCKF